MLNDRIEQVKKIPSLGIGGLAVWQELVKYSQFARSGEAIVDIGSWLGSTIGFLLAGIENSGEDVDIHSYDRWIADKTFQKRAKDYHDIDFELDQDLLSVMMMNLSMFRKQPIPHKGSFREQFYTDDRRIALIVDDICTYKTMTDHMWDIFGDKLIPGRTIVMMLDYYWYETRPESCRRYQKDCMALNKNAGIFEFVERPMQSMCSVWRYLGGTILRVPDDPKYHAEYY
jgi:hypothetical protein